VKNKVFAIGDWYVAFHLVTSILCDVIVVLVSSNCTVSKTYVGFQDQIPVVVGNVLATLHNTDLRSYIRGYFSSMRGPIFVALGHNHEDGFGIGPDLPGLMGFICWACCVFGYPCAPPAGEYSLKYKSNLNNSISPKPGRGFSA